MSRAAIRRLEKLERGITPTLGKAHIRFGHSDEELERELEDLKASAEWSEGDRIIAVRFVSPDETRAGVSHG